MSLSNQQPDGLPNFNFEVIKGLGPEEIKNHIDEIAVQPPVSTPEEFDPKIAYQKSKITTADPIPEPAKVLSIIQNGIEIPIATAGNFSLLIGKAKSKKTFTIASFVSAALVSGNGFLKSYLPEGKNKVLLFDTEQGKYHTQKLLNRILRIHPLSVETQIEVYNIREYSYDQRIQIIEHGLSLGGFGLVIIDGIRDLVSDINDSNQGSDMTTKLLNWTTNFECHIIAVLHTNKGDSNARGHLGTELTNKAETTILIQKDPHNPDISIISAEYTRDKSFQDFAIKIDDTGLPILLEDYVPAQKGDQKGKKGWEPSDINQDEHWEVLNGIWNTSIIKKIKWGQTRDEIKKGFQKIGIKLGLEKVRKLINYYVENGYLITEKGPSNTTLYSIPYPNKIDHENEDRNPI